MRYVAPPRETIDPRVFDRPPLAAWRIFDGLLCGADWPTVDALNACLPPGSQPRFVAQTPALLADGLHYEQRIAGRGAVATRERNWHDLLNALVWLRYPALKRALNRRQMAEIVQMGPKQRSRPQYAMTHFDEAGVIVTLRDPGLLALWDAHDWHGLFWRHRQAWLDGSLAVEVFGHALLEHALTPGKLLVGKAVVFDASGAEGGDAPAALAAGIDHGQMLRDPLELRPLPLSGIPGWHPDNAHEAFHCHNPSYQPRRPDRHYPDPWPMRSQVSPCPARHSSAL